jgi:hypothetical protein
LLARARLPAGPQVGARLPGGALPVGPQVGALPAAAPLALAAPLVEASFGRYLQPVALLNDVPSIRFEDPGARSAAA